MEKAITTKATVKKSWYTRYLWLLLILGGALLYGILLTLLTYPGIFYSDSYGRADLAVALTQGGNRANLGTTLSLLPEFVIALCLKLTGRLAGYTVLQATGFAVAVMLAMFYYFPGREAVILSVMALACPLAFGYAVYWEPGVVTAVGLLLLVMTGDAFRCGNKKAPVLFLVAFCFFCLTFLLVGYRLNAATAVVGMILCEIFAAMRCPRLVKDTAVKVAAMALGIVLALQLPQLVGMKNISNGVIGPMWETACMLNRIGEGNGYDEYLDDLLTEGSSTRDIFAATDTPEKSMYEFEGILPYWTAPSNPDTSKQYMQKYKTLVMQKSWLFLRVKWELAKRTLSALPFAEYDYNRFDRMKEYNFHDTPQRQKFYEIVTNFAEHCHWMRTPWAVLLTAAVLLVLCKIRKGCTRQAGNLFFVALCYEGGFFITTQNHEFRYWFPALMLLVFSICISLKTLLGTMMKSKTNERKCYSLKR